MHVISTVQHKVQKKKKDPVIRIHVHVAQARAEKKKTHEARPATISFRYYDAVKVC